MQSVDPGIRSESVCFPFTPSQTARELLFYPTWCGHYYCTANYFMKRDSYPPLLIAYIRKGRFRVEYRGEFHVAEAGDVLLLDCIEPHYYHAEDGLEFVYMHFEGSNARELCRRITERHGWLIRRDNNTLIGNLLELARTDNRQPLIRRETFDLSMLADWAAAGMAGRRNVRVINGSAGAVPVSADREMIRRLLLILLDNAVKYSPENSQVTVRVLKEDKGCRIEVEDQGIGIDEKDIPHIFERFYRADKTRSRQTAGTGLGLSIAMEIAERHGGIIEVKSTPGKGSLFVVRLPDD